MEHQNKKMFLINLIYYSVIGVLIFISVRFLLLYLFPLVIAAVVAHFAQRPSNAISQKTKLPLSVCSVITVILFFIFIISLSVLLIYMLFSFIKAIFGDFSVMGEMLGSFLEKIRGIYSDYIYKISPEIAVMLEDMAGDFLSRFSQRLVQVVSNFAAGLAKSIPSFFLSSIVALVAGCYIAKDYCGWIGFLKGICSKRFIDTLIKIKEVLSGSVNALLKGYVKLWFITFAELLVGFWILRIKYALILALAVSFVDLLPIFGTGTVLIPWGIAELIADNPFIGFGLLILYILITLVRNFLEPKIIGRQIGINPLLTLIAMFAGLRFFGFWGLILFPLALITVVKYYKKEMSE